jgi:hypothetical protein
MTGREEEALTTEALHTHNAFTCSVFRQWPPYVSLRDAIVEEEGAEVLYSLTRCRGLNVVVR